MRRQVDRKTLAVTLTTLLMGASLFAQGTIYPAGDGVTWTESGREVCGTFPIDLNVVDSVYYSTASASEFAATTPQLYGSIPNPMGRNVGAASVGPTGVTLVNPTSAPFTVTEIQIDAGGLGLFNGIDGVAPGFQ